MRVFVKRALILSLFVLCLLALTVLGASAATPTGDAADNGTTHVAKIEVSDTEYFYTSLKTAVEEAFDNGVNTVTVLRDATVGSGDTIAITGNMAIVSDSAVTITNSTGGPLFNITAGSLDIFYQITITDTPTDAVAMVADAYFTRYYADLNTAVADAYAPTVTVLKDTTVNTQIAVNGDLTIRSSANVTITNGTSTDLFAVADSAKLTFYEIYIPDDYNMYHLSVSDDRVADAVAYWSTSMAGSSVGIYYGSLNAAVAEVSGYSDHTLIVLKNTTVTAQIPLTGAIYLTSYSSVTITNSTGSHLFDIQAGGELGIADDTVSVDTGRSNHIIYSYDAGSRYYFVDLPTAVASVQAKDIVDVKVEDDVTVTAQISVTKRVNIVGGAGLSINNNTGTALFAVTGNSRLSVDALLTISGTVADAAASNSGVYYGSLNAAVADIGSMGPYVTVLKNTAVTSPVDVTGDVTLTATSPVTITSNVSGGLLFRVTGGTLTFDTNVTVNALQVTLSGTTYYYSTLAQAIAAVPADGTATISVVGTVTMTDANTLITDKDITIQGANRASGYDIVFSPAAGVNNALIHLRENGSVTFKDLRVNITAGAFVKFDNVGPTTANSGDSLNVTLTNTDVVATITCYFIGNADQASVKNGATNVTIDADSTVEVTMDGNAGGGTSAPFDGYSIFLPRYTCSSAFNLEIAGSFSVVFGASYVNTTPFRFFYSSNFGTMRITFPKNSSLNLSIPQTVQDNVPANDSNGSDLNLIFIRNGDGAQYLTVTEPVWNTINAAGFRTITSSPNSGANTYTLLVTDRTAANDAAAIAQGAAFRVGSTEGGTIDGAGAVYFTTLAGAIANGAASEPIVVLTNYTMDAAQIIPSRDITIVGKTPDITITTSSASNNRFYEATSGTRTLTVRDLTFVGTSNNIFLTRNGSTVTYNFDNVTINAVTSLFYFDGTSHNTLTIANSEINVSANHMFSLGGSAVIDAVTVTNSEITLTSGFMFNMPSGAAAVTALTMTDVTLTGALLNRDGGSTGTFGTSGTPAVLNNVTVTRPNNDKSIFIRYYGTGATYIDFNGGSYDMRKDGTDAGGSCSFFYGCDGNAGTVQLRFNNSGATSTTVTSSVSGAALSPYYSMVYFGTGASTVTIIANNTTFTQTRSGGYTICYNGSGTFTGTFTDCTFNNYEGCPVLSLPSGKSATMTDCVVANGIGNYASLIFSTDAKAIAGGASFRVGSTEGGAVYFDTLAGAIAAAPAGTAADPTPIYLLTNTTITANTSITFSDKCLKLASVGSTRLAITYAIEHSNYFILLGEGASLTLENVEIVTNGRGFAVDSTNSAKPAALTLGDNAWVHATASIASGNCLIVLGSGGTSTLVYGSVQINQTARIGYDAYSHTARAGADKQIIFAYGQFHGDINIDGELYSSLTTNGQQLISVSGAFTGDITFTATSKINMTLKGVSEAATTVFSVTAAFNGDLTLNGTITLGTSANAFENTAGLTGALLRATANLGDVTIGGTINGYFEKSSTFLRFESGSAIAGTLTFDGVIDVNIPTMVNFRYKHFDKVVITNNANLSISNSLMTASSVYCGLFYVTAAAAYEQINFEIEGGSLTVKNEASGQWSMPMMYVTNPISLNFKAASTWTNNTPGGNSSMFFAQDVATTTVSVTAASSSALPTVTCAANTITYNAANAANGMGGTTRFTATNAAAEEFLASAIGFYLDIGGTKYFHPSFATLFNTLAPATGTGTLYVTKNVTVSGAAVITSKTITFTSVGERKSLSFNDATNFLISASDDANLTFTNISIVGKVGHAMKFMGSEGHPSTTTFGNGAWIHGDTPGGSTCSLIQVPSGTFYADIIFDTGSRVGWDAFTNTRSNNNLQAFFIYGTLIGDITIRGELYTEMSSNYTGGKQAFIQINGMTGDFVVEEGAVLRASTPAAAGSSLIEVNAAINGDMIIHGNPFQIANTATNFTCFAGNYVIAKFDSDAIATAVLTNYFKTGAYYSTSLDLAIATIPAGGSGTVTVVGSPVITFTKTENFVNGSRNSTLYPHAVIMNKTVTVVGDNDNTTTDITFSPASTSVVAALFELRQSGTLILQDLNIHLTKGQLAGFDNCNYTTAGSGNIVINLVNTKITGSPSGYLVGNGGTSHSPGSTTLSATNPTAGNQSVSFNVDANSVIDLTLSGEGATPENYGFVLFYHRWVATNKFTATINGTLKVSVPDTAKAFLLGMQANMTNFNIDLSGAKEVTLTVPAAVQAKSYTYAMGYSSAQGTVLTLTAAQLNYLQSTFTNGLFQTVHANNRYVLVGHATEAQAIAVGYTFRLGTATEGDLGTVYFNSLADAIAAAASGSNIYVIAPTTVTGQNFIVENKTINLVGKGTDAVDITFAPASPAANNALFQVKATANVNAAVNFVDIRINMTGDALVGFYNKTATSGSISTTLTNSHVTGTVSSYLFGTNGGHSDSGTAINDATNITIDETSTITLNLNSTGGTGVLGNDGGYSVFYFRWRTSRAANVTVNGTLDVTVGSSARAFTLGKGSNYQFMNMVFGDNAALTLDIDASLKTSIAEADRIYLSVWQSGDIQPTFSMTGAVATVIVNANFYSLFPSRVPNAVSVRGAVTNSIATALGTMFKLDDGTIYSTSIQGCVDAIPTNGSGTIYVIAPVTVTATTSVLFNNGSRQAYVNSHAVILNKNVTVMGDNDDATTDITFSPTASGAYISLLDVRQNGTLTLKDINVALTKGMFVGFDNCNATSDGAGTITINMVNTKVTGTPTGYLFGNGSSGHSPAAPANTLYRNAQITVNIDEDSVIDISFTGAGGTSHSTTPGGFVLFYFRWYVTKKANVNVDGTIRVNVPNTANGFCIAHQDNFNNLNFDFTDATLDFTIPAAVQTINTTNITTCGISYGTSGGSITVTAATGAYLAGIFPNGILRSGSNTVLNIVGDMNDAQAAAMGFTFRLGETASGTSGVVYFNAIGSVVSAAANGSTIYIIKPVTVTTANTLLQDKALTFVGDNDNLTTDITFSPSASTGNMLFKLQTTSASTGGASVTFQDMNIAITAGGLVGFYNYTATAGALTANLVNTQVTGTITCYLFGTNTGHSASASAMNDACVVNVDANSSITLNLSGTGGTGVLGNDGGYALFYARWRTSRAFNVNYNGALDVTVGASARSFNIGKGSNFAYFNLNFGDSATLDLDIDASLKTSIAEADRPYLSIFTSGDVKTTFVMPAAVATEIANANFYSLFPNANKVMGITIRGEVENATAQAFGTTLCVDGTPKLYFNSMGAAFANAPAGTAAAPTTILVLGNVNSQVSAITNVSGKFLKLKGQTGTETLAIDNSSGAFVIGVGNDVSLTVEDLEITCFGRLFSLTAASGHKSTVTIGDGAWVHAPVAGGYVNAMFYAETAIFADVIIDEGAKVGFDAFTTNRTTTGDMFLYLQAVNGDITIRGEVYSNLTSTYRYNLIWLSKGLTGTVMVEDTARINLGGSVAANSSFFYSAADVTGFVNILGDPSEIFTIAPGSNYKIAYGLQGATQALDSTGKPIHTVYTYLIRNVMKAQGMPSALAWLQGQYANVHDYRVFMTGDAAGGYGGNLSTMVASGDIHVLFTGDDPYTETVEQFLLNNTGYTHTSAPGGNQLFQVTNGADITFENIRIYRCGRFLTSTNANSNNPTDIVLGNNVHVYGSPDINCMFSFSISDNANVKVYANLTIEEGAVVEYTEGWNNRDVTMIFAVSQLVGDITINGTLAMNFTSGGAFFHRMFASYASNNSFQGTITIGGNIIYDVKYVTPTLVGNALDITGNGDVVFKEGCSVYYRNTGNNAAASAFYGKNVASGYMPNLAIEGGQFMFETGYGFLLNSARPNQDDVPATYRVFDGAFFSTGEAAFYVDNDSLQLSIYGGLFAYEGENAGCAPVVLNTGVIRVEGGMFYTSSTVAPTIISRGNSTVRLASFTGMSPTGVLYSGAVTPTGPLTYKHDRAILNLITATIGARPDFDVTGTGLGFRATLTPELYARLCNFADDATDPADDGVTFGMLYAPASELPEGVIFTHTGLAMMGIDPTVVTTLREGDEHFSVETQPDGCVLIRGSFAPDALDTRYSAVFFAEFTIDGHTTRVYSDFNASENTRSLEQVVRAAYNDLADVQDSETYKYEAGTQFSPYNDTDRAALATLLSGNTDRKVLDLYVLAGGSNAAGFAPYSGAFVADYLNANTAYGDGHVLYSGLMFNNIPTALEGNITSNRITKYVPGSSTVGFFRGWNEESFGPEVGMAAALSNQYTTDYAAIVKFAAVDSTVQDWNGTYASELLAFLTEEVTLYTRQGYDVTVKGIYWMGGEADMANANYASALAAMLTSLVQNMGNALPLDTDFAINVANLSNYDAATGTLLPNKDLNTAIAEVAAENGCTVSDVSDMPSILGRITEPTDVVLAGEMGVINLMIETGVNDTLTLPAAEMIVYFVVTDENGDPVLDEFDNPVRSEYHSIVAAFAYMPEGTTLYISHDLMLYTTTLLNGKNVKFEGTGTGADTITFGATAGAGMSIDNSNVTFANIKLVQNGHSSDSYVLNLGRNANVILGAGAELSADNTVVNLKNKALLTVDGAKLTGTSGNGGALLYTSGGDIILKDAEFNAAGNTACITIDETAPYKTAVSVASATFETGSNVVFINNAYEAILVVANDVAAQGTVMNVGFGTNGYNEH